jgi:hypothetical protein
VQDVASESVALDTVVFLAADGDGIIVYNLIDDSTLTRKSASSSNILQDVAISGNTAFVHQLDFGITMLDVSEPASPFILDQYPSRYLSKFIWANDDLVAMSQVEPDICRIELFNANNPENISPISYFSLISDPIDVAFLGDRLLITYMEEIMIQDVNDPFHPTLLSENRTQDYVHRAAAYSEGMLYVLKHASIYNEYLRAYDVSDREHIELMGSILLDRSLPIAAYRRTIYVSNGIIGNDSLYAGIAIIDASNPANMVQVTRFGRGDGVRTLKVSGNYLYVGLIDKRIRIYDISNPEHPHLRGEVQGNGIPYCLEPNLSNLFVAEGNGLAIYDCSDALYVASSLPNTPMLLSLQSFPNPFNSTTTISYSLPTPGRYAIDVVDIQGRLVTRLADGWREPGSYREVLNGEVLPSGNYMIQVNGDKSTELRGVTLLK